MSTKGVTTAQAINYWYNILDFELKDLVRARVLSLPSGNPPTLEFVFLANDSIGVNLAREKAATPIVSKTPKSTEKGKISTKATILAFTRQGDSTDSKSQQLIEKYCSGCGSSTHPAARCWAFHPELKPAKAKTTRNASKGDKNGTCKPSKGNAKRVAKKVDNKKSDNQDELHFKTIEAQLALIVVALKSKDASKVEKMETPSYYGAWDESFYGMAEVAYVTTRAQAQMEVPRGATSTLDPQVGEARQQVRLPKSFVLEDLNSTPPSALQKDAVVIASCKNRSKSTVKDGVSAAATIVCQILLFSAQMVGACGFDVVFMLKKAAAMCRAKEGQCVAPMEIGALTGFDSEVESIMGANLYAAATRIQTMLRRSAIERASLTPKVVIVDNRV